MESIYLFAEEDESKYQVPDDFWKIMIVDDEPEIHAVTKLALNDFLFLERRLEFVSAYSGQEACELMAKHPDTAIVLLDVVMETSDAGLKVARYIREQLNNRYTRIILRTGQPGHAPERTVVIEYDINEYKSKTELTAQKLFTSVMASLRSYRDIMSVVHSRHGLIKMMGSIQEMYNLSSKQQLLGSILEQLAWLIGAKEAYFATYDRTAGGIFRIQAEYGSSYAQPESLKFKDVLPIETHTAVDHVLQHKQSFIAEEFALVCCPHTQNSVLGALYLGDLIRGLDDKEIELLEAFTLNVQAALEQVLIKDDFVHYMQRLISRMVQLERHEYLKERGEHNGFIAFVDAISQGLHLPEEDAVTIGLAAQLYQRIDRNFTFYDSGLDVPKERLQKVLNALAPMKDNQHPSYVVMQQSFEWRFGVIEPEIEQQKSWSQLAWLLHWNSFFYRAVKADQPIEDIQQALTSSLLTSMPQHFLNYLIEHQDNLYKLAQQLIEEQHEPTAS